MRVKCPALRHTRNKEQRSEGLVVWAVRASRSLCTQLAPFGYNYWQLADGRNGSYGCLYAASCLLSHGSPFSRNFTRGIRRGSPEGREANQKNRGHDCRRDRQAHGQYEHGRPFQSAPRRSDGGAPEHRHGLWLAPCRARTHCEWSKYAEYRVRAPIRQEYLAAR